MKGHHKVRWKGSLVRTEHIFKPVKGYCPAMRERCRQKMAEHTGMLEYNPGLMEKVTG